MGVVYCVPHLLLEEHTRSGWRYTVDQVAHMLDIATSCRWGRGDPSRSVVRAGVRVLVHLKGVTARYTDCTADRRDTRSTHHHRRLRTQARREELTGPGSLQVRTQECGTSGHEATVCRSCHHLNAVR
jgi:hypothetical protein